MLQKFQQEDKVRHRDGLITMTVTDYKLKKEYIEPLSLLGGPRNYKLVPTEYVNCRWLDVESNSPRSATFLENDLIKIDL
jgi:uncharacterized protein YodC (DUF2158 family)